jgi:catechol 2,3-dioxygenase-like lactoylglutathione lyase family enzyme
VRIALTSIYVEDPVGKAYAFYTEVLGFVPKLFVPEAELVILASPEDPEGTALLLEPNTHPVAEIYQQGLFELDVPAIIFSVADIAAEYDRLTGLGVLFRSEPARNETGVSTVFEDTCGNLIELYQPL